MVLSGVTSPNLILLDKEWNTRESILENLSMLLYQEGKSPIKQRFSVLYGSGKTFLKQALNKVSPSRMANRPS